MIFYKVYRNALSATLISVLAGGFITGGIIIAIASFSEGQPGNIIITAVMAGIGILLRKLADKQAIRVRQKKGLNNNA